jgi:4-amino-4-deoxy-L-arabinose transferase-like glycosyltransferase
LNVRFGSIVMPALLAILAGALYLPRRDVPRYLAPDEMFSALTAHSVATTGRDLNGRFMPLYFQLPDSFETRMWYQPIVVYAIAASVKVLPFSQSNVRLPMALAAVADILLAYYVGRVLFRSQTLAVAAAVLLALTPAHFSDSRVAMDHHSFLPFILGWLLCVLLYLERRHRYLLFGAGLTLGVGLFTYIASYVLMPAFALMTVAVLYWRREPLRAYAALAGGFFLPLAIGALYIASHPAVITDTLWRYQRQQASVVDRLMKVGAVYASFWQPRVLFISGPRAIWIAGQFLLPVAGLLIAAGMKIVRKPDTPALLLLAGLLIAPLPASVVGEPEVIRRAAGVMPFAVLLAALGLEYVWRAESERTQRIAFTAIWVTVIGLTMLYYQDVPHAQALVRAATVPLAVTGLAVLFNDVRFDSLSIPRIAIVSSIVLVAMHLAYFVWNQATPAGVALLAAVSLMTLVARPPARLANDPTLAVALLALVAGHFTYNYVDYAQIHRVGAVPASALILALRLVVAFAATGAALAVARVAQRSRGLLAVAVVALVAVQLAYFSIDRFTDYRLRIVQAVAVVAAAVGLSMLLRRSDAFRRGLGPVAAAGLLTIAVAQFVPFYTDYFSGFRARGAPLPVSARPAFDALLSKAHEDSSQAIYLGWPYALGELYWRFYLIEQHREDLLARTVPDLDFKPDRIRALPRGSLVLTTPSPAVDAQIDEMTARGDVAHRDLLRDVDGTPTFWILETGAH